jgi:hypothetical protein
MDSDSGYLPFTIRNVTLLVAPFPLSWMDIVMEIKVIPQPQPGRSFDASIDTARMRR